MPVRIERDGPVTTVIMNRPEVRNAVDHATALELQKAFVEFDADPDAYVGVLCGDNGTFCAGYDLKSVASGQGVGRYDPEGDGPMGPTRMLLNKPVIAAVSGYAVAGGLELALWCDLRVMEEDAQVGVFCRRWGVPLIDGGTVRLPRLIGLSRALDLILTGRAVGAQEALAMGLCNRIAPKGQGREVARQLAHEIARFPQLCLRTDRMSAYKQWDLDLVEALKNEGREGLAPLRAEARAGAARFAAGKGRGGSFEDI
ncbi:MAG TPA: crotonase/enoyl-CoA hydratase family protein [Methylomirabilota bacterium]|jgi:enoyl-CoA hydratase|nr:crotonase/enoyl-CoA hydratase family protein [Methylomirabilota bacterium]